MAKRGRMEIRCSVPNCGKLFEAPTMRYQQFRDLFMKYGWRVRGFHDGWRHFCDEHTEADL